jgi:hypothetical protein
MSSRSKSGVARTYRWTFYRPALETLERRESAGSLLFVGPVFSLLGLPIDDVSGTPQVSGMPAKTSTDGTDDDSAIDNRENSSTSSRTSTRDATDTWTIALETTGPASSPDATASAPFTGNVSSDGNAMVSSAPPTSQTTDDAARSQAIDSLFGEAGWNPGAVNAEMGEALVDDISVNVRVDFSGSAGGARSPSRELPTPLSQAAAPQPQAAPDAARRIDARSGSVTEIIIHPGAPSSALQLAAALLVTTVAPPSCKVAGTPTAPVRVLNLVVGPPTAPVMPMNWVDAYLARMDTALAGDIVPLKLVTTAVVPPIMVTPGLYQTSDSMHSALGTMFARSGSNADGTTGTDDARTVAPGTAIAFGSAFQADWSAPFWVAPTINPQESGVFVIVIQRSCPHE